MNMNGQSADDLMDKSQDDVTDATNDVTTTTSGGNNSRALSEDFYSL